MQSTHRRGRSFESGLMLKAKDDDLALFNEMQNRERENFLLHSTDDFDDSICNASSHPCFNIYTFHCLYALVLY